MVRRISTSSGRTRQAAVLALLVAVAVVVILMLSAGSRPSPDRATSPATTAGSVTVRRHNLVETDTESGTLSYADPQTVYDRLSGTITWLPSVGQVIKPGQALYRVDGEPVLLMTGSVPAYRVLSSADGDSADVEQLNRNLVVLGFDPDGIVIDDAWQPATTAGVKLLQESLGEKASGRLALGRIVFAPGDQLVSTLDATVGSTGGGGASPASGAGTEASVPAGGHAEFVGLRTTTTSTPKSRHRAGGSAASLAELTAALREEVAQLKAATAALRAAEVSGGNSAHSSSSGNSASSSDGRRRASASRASAGGGSATPILQTNSTRLVVTVDLSASSQSEAVIGERVGVELPAGNIVGGRISAVSPVAESPSSSAQSGGGGAGGGGGTGASSATVPVTITLNGHHLGAGLDQAAVSVSFTQAKAEHVLSVPVTALIATSGGTYAVQEASAPYTLLPVRTGLFAAGLVRISGAGIHAGLQVTDSQG